MTRFGSRPGPAVSRRPVLARIGAAAIIAGLASPAHAAPEPRTKLVRCGEESCLQISGRRDDRAVIVTVNGHAVTVEGGRRWRVRLPVDVIRQWSPRHARRIEVSLRDPDTQGATTASVDLPVGLLGGLTDFTPLMVSAR